MEIFDVIRAAWKSRLIGCDDRSYREITGVTFESVHDHRDDVRVMERYYEMLGGECHRQCGESLYAMTCDYLGASAVCQGRDFDWMQRRQLASRKKFCRWLFRRVVTAEKNISVADEMRFSPKGCDEALMRAMYPEGPDGEPAVDMAFVMLITFGVVRPYDVTAQRSRDITDKEVSEACEALKVLISVLKDDMPAAGALSKPIAFDEALNQVDNWQQSQCDGFTIAKAWRITRGIEDACKVAWSPQKTVENDLLAKGLTMPGIWIDDTNRGMSRFWVFPENMMMAFCYYRSGNQWKLQPYEFGFAGDDTCIFVTAKGNQLLIANGGTELQPTEVVTANYVSNISCNEISFEVKTGKTPLWFDWNKFIRLDTRHPVHEKSMRALNEIYDARSPQSALFENKAPFLTDITNCLIGLDGEYLYVTEQPGRGRFMLRHDADACERFRYEPVNKSDRPAESLRSIEISEAHPLYVIPRHATGNQFGRKRRVAEAIGSTTSGDQITIYHPSKYPEGLMCFSNFSVFLPLTTDAMDDYGIKRITDRSGFFIR